MGVCSGGTITAMVAAHLAHRGQQDRIAALTLMVTVLDQARAGLASAVISERNARMAAAASRARGYLDGRSLAEVFAWLRPNDLIWNYWVNNYLLGRQPPAFDILSWNADTTRMTAGLHRDFLELGVKNALVQAGAATMLGSPVNLALVDRDCYQVAGTARPTPATGCGTQSPAAAPGGRTTRRGWRNAADRRKTLQPNRAAAG